MTDATVLNALRACPTWEEVAAYLALDVPTARARVGQLMASRVPQYQGEVIVPEVSAQIVRDRWGVPHVLAGSEVEAYVGLGFAMGQDRLWQLDALRRAAHGTLAEVLGSDVLEGDRLARTLGFTRVAEAGEAALTGEARETLEAFCGGLNLARVLAQRDGLPFEFDFLEYEPEPWTPADSLAVMRAFWWQLTGRFPIICLPETARRLLGEGPLFEAFLRSEGNEATIWPRGVPHPELAPWQGGSRESSGLTDSGAVGSNNWVVGASRSSTGAPLLCSDPHVPFLLPSVWYEARIRGGELDAAGALYAGVPGIFFGRNREVAWGLTNNISMLRDLYLEVTDDFDPDRYRRGHEWKSFTRHRETIAVRGGEPVTLEVTEVDHGPVVSEFLPGFAPVEETVSVRWVGHEPTRELETMVAYAKAGSAAEFRACLRDWHCPTFNFLMADRAGEIGYQLTGKIPLRRRPERGYRPGDDPEHAWQGYVPFEALPGTGEPPEGWLGSANNRVVTDDWPYPLSGTWPSDLRMQRLIDVLNRPGPITPEAMAAGQSDAYGPRAARWTAPAVDALRASGVEHPLLDELRTWNHTYDEDSRAACVFEAFFVEWSRAVLTHRLPAAMFPVAFANAGGLTEGLLEGDPAGWFKSAEERQTALREAWKRALEWLRARMGDPAEWRWGRIHTLTLQHPLGRTPVLAELLNRGPYPHAGTWNTLNNSLYEPDRAFESITGVSYRLLVDLAGATCGVNASGQSGHPGSPHYVDQIPLWQVGEYHPLDLAEDPQGESWVIRPE